MISLYEVKFIETESGLVVGRGWRKEGISNGLMGTEFQFGEMKDVWRWMVMVAQQYDCT